MAGQTYQLNITGNAEKTLLATQKAAANLGSVMNRLGDAIAGIAIAGFISRTQQLAASMVNLSAATGISVGQIAAFSRALSTSGGTADQARDAISDLTKNIGDAVRGSSELQKAFKTAGVSLNDLATLSEGEIFTKLLTGLNQIPDRATRSSVAMQILGESVKGVDLGTLNAEFQASAGSIGAYAENIKAAAEAQKSIRAVLENFTQALTNVTAPLNQIVSGVKISVEAFETLIKIVAALGASFLIFTRVLPAIQGATNAFYGLAVAGSALAKPFQQVGGHLVRMIGHLGRVVTGAGQAGSRFASLGLAVSQAVKAFLRFAGIIGIVYAVAEGVDFLLKKLNLNFSILDTLGNAYEWLKGKLGLFKEETKEADKATADLGTTAAAATEGQVDRWVEINRQVKEFAVGIQQSIQAYKDQVAASQAAFVAETRLVGKTEEQRLAVQELASAYQTYLTERRKLEQELQKLQATGLELDALKAKEVQTALGQLDTAYQQNTKAIQSNAEARVQALRSNAERLRVIREEIDLSNNLLKIQDSMAKSTMTEMERKYYDIAAAARDSARAAIEEEQARRGVKLTLAEMDQYYSRAAAAAEKLIKAEKQAADQNRTFTSGWQKAFRQYVEDAGNAAAQATKLFQQFTQGIEDALVNFVKTGKLNFKSLVQDMAETLLRSQIRQTIASIGSALGMGGMFGGGGGNGAGSSPSNPLYVLDVAGGGGAQGVGQRIGGLISGGGTGGGGLGNIGNTIKTVASTVSTIAGGLGSAIGNIGSSIFDTVSSIGSSIGDFFGGFFAKGGTLGAGKWGIAGEAGPEIISGPANITPMGAMGGSTVVTYNINAVDAASFKAMIAADPSFLFAVTEQGRRGLPGGRR